MDFTILLLIMLENTKREFLVFFFYKNIKLKSPNFPSLTARKSLVMTENTVGLDLRLLPSKVKAALNLSQCHAFKSIVQL